jgi:glycosyltransferase involved in cell wall biosynthesis
VKVFVTRHLMTPLRPNTRRYLARWAHVIAVSDAVLAHLRAGDPQHSLRVRRVHCGIDLGVFRPDPARGLAWRRARQLPDSAWLFAVVGAIHGPEGKGQFVMLEAARALLKRHPDTHFLCLGDGDGVPELQRRALALGLDGRFHWRGFDDEADAAFQAIDVLVHPAVSSEALGLVILEALATGKPVIASRLDGIGETFVDGRHGLAVPPRDSKALADAMLCLADDRERARAYGAAGREWLEQGFSLRTLGRQTVDAYRDALHGRW